MVVTVRYWERDGSAGWGGANTASAHAENVVGRNFCTSALPIGPVPSATYEPKRYIKCSGKKNPSSPHLKPALF